VPRGQLAEPQQSGSTTVPRIPKTTLAPRPCARKVRSERVRREGLEPPTRGLRVGSLPCRTEPGGAVRGCSRQRATPVPADVEWCRPMPDSLAPSRPHDLGPRQADGCPGNCRPRRRSDRRATRVELPHGAGDGGCRAQCGAQVPVRVVVPCRGRSKRSTIDARVVGRRYEDERSDGRHVSGTSARPHRTSLLAGTSCRPTA
jgi:hypothetical protein